MSSGVNNKARRVRRRASYCCETFRVAVFVVVLTDSVPPRGVPGDGLGATVNESVPLIAGTVDVAVEIHGTLLMKLPKHRFGGIPVSIQVTLAVN